MTTLLGRLDALIDRWHLLKHPFYQAWTNGELSRGTLQRYAGQYYAQVAEFPRFVSSIHSRCPEIAARKVLTENLADEEIHGTDHPELWMQFAEGLGCKRDDVATESWLPETTDMVNTYWSLATGPWVQGLCALYAYESQVPLVSASKISGLERFYGIEDPKTLAFFKVHQHYDVEHSRKVGELVARYGQPAEAERATERAAQALWGFLDGVAREAGISCHVH